MKSIEQIREVYFIGAGGIGMSALVRYFLSKGIPVAGYDMTPSALTEALIREGADLHFREDRTLIPELFRDSEGCLVIYTPAIPKEHEELLFFLEGGYTVMKRAQVLGLITRSTKGLCVAGTHGKTTTSTMLAHILHQSHVGCTAFLGGISKNYGTNLLLGPDSPYTVIEADEFDRSFHHLRPWMSVITATDADHLDIYGSHEAYLESFSHYTGLIQEGGILLLHRGLEMQPRCAEGVRTYTYSQQEGDFRAGNVRIQDGRIILDLIHPDGLIRDVELGVPVLVNIENAVAAMAIARLAGATDQEIREAMKSFQGVVRRFDFIERSPQGALLMDYAHHPMEIRRSAESLRALYPGKVLTAIFQPHLYTRTRDFYGEFASSLSLFDEVVLTEIYPAREKPIEGVTSRLILDHLEGGIRRFLCQKSEVAQVLRKECRGSVTVLLGAGDIDRNVESIRSALKERDESKA